jgi:5-methylcytosine-specific restriction enzyme subunit McrC
LVILPKFDGLDFMKMFMTCFENKDIGNYVEMLFYINVNDKPIPIPQDQFKIEPLTVAYFINLVSEIVNQGLKKDFIIYSETLKGKVKGKILFTEYLRHQVAKKRYDKIPCSYQEYEYDCLENRVIKKALILCKRYLIRNKKSFAKLETQIERMVDKALVAFRNVGDDVYQWELERIHINPIFKYYKLALPLAKMIILNQGLHVNTEHQKGVQLFPPFIINMPILFELYVLHHLRNRYGNEEIGYQKRTSDGRNILDFIKLNDKLIIDTKYKKAWEEGESTDNIRQLSGYARNNDVRRRILNCYDEHFVCPCLILYPNNERGVKDFESAPEHWLDDDGTIIFDEIERVDSYQKFYKLGVKLPNNTSLTADG